MNIIIYTEDFEPITVIDLPLEVLDTAEKKGGIMLALKHRDNQTSLIQVDCHKLKWIDGSTKIIFVTKEEELALLLCPEWLVGQKAVVGTYERSIKILTNKLTKFKRND